MRRVKKSLRFFLLLLAAFFVAERLLAHVLASRGLALRGGVQAVVYLGYFLLTVAVAAHFVLLFRQWLKGKEKGTFLRMVTATLGTLLIAAVLSGGLWVGSRVIFSSEYVVERDGEKMVACVSNFVRVVVRYYDYGSTFVRGEQVLIAEDYGELDEDPFEMETMPDPLRVVHYDRDGQILLPK